MTRQLCPRRLPRPIARGIAIVVLVSVATSAAAVCFSGAPAAMACCDRSAQDAPPVLRACCGPAESTPATAQSYTATAPQAPVQAVAFPVSGDGFSKTAAPARATRAARVEIRLLNSVFLI